MVVDFSIFPRAEHQWAIISSLGVMFSTQLSCVWFLIEAFISTSVSCNRPQNVCVCVSRNIMCIYKRGGGLEKLPPPSDKYTSNFAFDPSPP